MQLSDPTATEVTLTDLQCNTNYTITVVATAGEHRMEGVVFLSLQGILIECLLTNTLDIHYDVINGAYVLSQTGRLYENSTIRYDDKL